MAAAVGGGGSGVVDECPQFTGAESEGRALQ